MPDEPDLRLRLTVDVAYNTNGASQDRLTRMLDDLPRYAAGDGALTGETEAEVDVWSSKVHVLGTDSQSPLLEEWLGAVNQPVVDDVLHRLKELLGITSDGGNFTGEQCQNLLIEILTHPAMLKEKSPSS